MKQRLKLAILIYPLFVVPGSNVRKEISSMPGVFHLSPRYGSKGSNGAAYELGIPAVIIFGIPEYKDAEGSSAWDMNSPVQKAMSLIKAALPEIVVIGDVCLCEYTSHGHCGML